MFKKFKQKIQEGLQNEIKNISNSIKEESSFLINEIDDEKKIFKEDLKDEKITGDDITDLIDNELLGGIGLMDTIKKPKILDLTADKLNKIASHINNKIP